MECSGCSTIGLLSMVFMPHKSINTEQRFKVRTLLGKRTGDLIDS